MNNDIKIMIELQRYCHAILSSKNKIANCNETIKKYETEQTGTEKALTSFTDDIRELKRTIRQLELDLGEKDGRIKKLNERKKNINTPKELLAVEKEIDMLKFDIGSLEEKILSLIDELDEKEKSHSLLSGKLLSEKNQFSEKRHKLDEEIMEQEKNIRLNEEKYNSLKEQLASSYKSKFIKMLNSKDGTAIAKLDGEICGNCNFKIPASLVIETSSYDAITNCTNCGRFIYI
jgi:predicted  nucleic acid-binding Zn-ribbon protein